MITGYPWHCLYWYEILNRQIIGTFREMKVVNLKIPPCFCQIGGPEIDTIVYQNFTANYPNKLLKLAQHWEKYTYFPWNQSLQTSHSIIKSSPSYGWRQIQYTVSSSSDAILPPRLGRAQQQVPVLGQGPIIVFSLLGRLGKSTEIQVQVYRFAL